MFTIKTDNAISERPTSGKLYIRATVLKAPEGFEQLVGARVRFNESDSMPILAKTGTYMVADFEIGPRDESDKGHQTFQAFNGLVVGEVPAEEAATLRLAERKAQLQQALAVDATKWTSNPNRGLAQAADATADAASKAATADVL